MTGTISDFITLSFYKSATAGSPCTHYKRVIIQRKIPEMSKRMPITVLMKRVILQVV